MCPQFLLKPVEAGEAFEGALTFPTHWLGGGSPQMFIYVFFFSVTHTCPLAPGCPSPIPPDPRFLHPRGHAAKSRVCAGESGAEHKAQLAVFIVG